MKILKYLLLILFLIRFTFCFSQTNLNNEVDVVKAYEPKLSDAFKIDILPKIIDTSITSPTFNYSLDIKQYGVEFLPEPIQPAKMIGEPLTKLYRHYVKFGYGNYNTILFDYNFSTLRSKQSMVGVNISHLSSDSKIKLSNNKKVYSGYSDNFVEVFGKRFFKTTNLYGDIDYNRNLVHLYGYNPEIDTIIKNNDNKQCFTLVNANAGIASNYIDSNHLNYNVDLHFHYFEDLFKSYENGLELSGKFNKKYLNQLFGGNVKINYNNKNSLLDTMNNSIVNIDPWIKLFVQQFEIIGGFDMVSDIYSDSVLYHFYPHLSVDYNIIDNILVPYIGFGGKLEQNSFKKNCYENPFIKSGVQIKNTNYNTIFFAGLRGNFSSKISYNLQIKYANINNMYFFVNDTTSKAENQFNVVYDNDINVMNYYCEIAYKKSEKLYFLLKGNYYKYTMNYELKPWHKPDYEIALTAKYNIQNKIIVSADIFGIGKRYAKTYIADSTNNKIIIPKALKEMIDANLSVEYRYNKNLSAFINFNNIGAVKYYRWNNYPAQQFNLLGGIIYSFL